MQQPRVQTFNDLPDADQVISAKELIDLTHEPRKKFASMYRNPATATKAALYFSICNMTWFVYDMVFKRLKKSFLVYVSDGKDVKRLEISTKVVASQLHLMTGDMTVTNILVRTGVLSDLKATVQRALDGALDYFTVLSYPKAGLCIFAVRGEVVKYVMANYKVRIDDAPAVILAAVESKRCTPAYRPPRSQQADDGGPCSSRYAFTMPFTILKMVMEHDVVVMNETAGRHERDCSGRHDCASCGRDSSRRTRRRRRADGRVKTKCVVKKCSGCWAVCYCSEECHVAHWPSHRDLCKSIQEELHKLHEENATWSDPERSRLAFKKTSMWSRREL